MTLQVHILIPVGQSYAGELVTVDEYNGTRTESAPVPIVPGVIVNTFATSTRSFIVREVVPKPVEAQAVDAPAASDASPE